MSDAVRHDVVTIMRNDNGLHTYQKLNVNTKNIFVLESAYGEFQVWF